MINLAPVSQLIAQNVPSPLAEFKYCGYFPCSSFNPLSKTSPVWQVFSNKLSAFMVLSTASNNINLPRIHRKPFKTILHLRSLKGNWPISTIK